MHSMNAQAMHLHMFTLSQSTSVRKKPLWCLAACLQHQHPSSMAFSWGTCGLQTSSSHIYLPRCHPPPVNPSPYVYFRLL